MAITGYDFCGYVTRNDLKCSDGRVIRKDAFAHQDGDKVPLAWNHNHDTPDACLGYTILKNREDGVYGYSYLNESPKAQQVKELVRHGDIDSYSIFANHLKQVSNQVYGGDIKEVSLVWSGANPGAYIEDVSFAHGDDPDSVKEAIIYTGDTEMEYNDNTMKHSDESTQKSYADILEAMTDEQKDAVSLLVGTILENQEMDEDEDYDSEEYEDYDESDEYDDDEYDEEYDEDYEAEMAHSGLYDNIYDEGDTTMKRNIFDDYEQGNVLTHSDFMAIKEDAKRCGSFKEAYHDYIENNGFMAHSAESDAAAGISRATGNQTYGFNDPDMLFPDYKALDPTPMWIKRDTNWVAEFWGKIHRVPFARVKSLYADITADEARAKGYIKGNRKEEEVFTTMKRVTEPTTVYKKQKLDKQDIDDITDFDVVAWIRAEMRIMLNEEIARAALIGDGRSAASPDKINPLNIRPVYLDDDFFVIRHTVTNDGNPDIVAKNIIRGAVKARKGYKGSGNTTLFTTEDILTDMLLLEDSIGHRLYKTEAELCAAMRVSKIVTVEVMEGLTNPTTGKPCAGIILNPYDYVVGANKGGNIDMFDDFDIDYNQYKYLLETRCSGALQKHHSAIVLELTVLNQNQNSESEPETNGEG